MKVPHLPPQTPAEKMAHETALGNIKNVLNHGGVVDGDYLPPFEYVLHESELSELGSRNDIHLKNLQIEFDPVYKTMSLVPLMSPSDTATELSDDGIEELVLVTMRAHHIQRILGMEIAVEVESDELESPLES